MNRFAELSAFWLLLLPVIVRFVLPAIKGLHGDALRIPFFNDLQNISAATESKMHFGEQRFPRFSAGSGLLWLIWILLVIAAARPQWVGEPVNLRSESRDILLVTDISTSMLEPDFVLNRRRIDRLTAVKKTAQDFIDKRLDDRIGLILFGTNAYLQAPPTYDRKAVGEILRQTDAGMAGQSTAIGDALGLALKTLKDAPHPDRKIIILLTDGENNDGSLSLPQAIKLARDEGVKIYTIGVGSDQAFSASFMGIRIGGGAPGLDEESLREIAAETKGRYFRARDTASLAKIYEAIDTLEPLNNEDQTIQEIHDWYYIPLLAAFALALVWGLATRRRRL